MFCNKCGSKLPDNAKFCNICGATVKNEKPQTQSQTQPQTQDQLKPPVQTDRQISAPIDKPAERITPVTPADHSPVPAKKSKRPLIIAIALAVVLALSGVGFAFRGPIMEAFNLGKKDDGEKTEQTDTTAKNTKSQKTDKSGEADIIDILEMSSNAFNSLSDFSGANVDVNVNVAMADASVSVKGNGFFDLGKDLENSSAYFNVSALGQKMEVAFTDGLFVYSDGSNTAGVRLSDISRAAGIDFNDIIKNGTVNIDYLFELLEDVYEAQGIPMEFSIDELMEKQEEMQELTMDYMRDHSAELEKVITVTTNTSSKIEYSIHMDECLDFGLGYVEYYMEYLAKNGSRSEKEMAETVLESLDELDSDALEDVRDVLAQIPDLNVVMELKNGQVQSADMKFEIEGIEMKASIKLAGKYFGGISFELKGDLSAISYEFDDNSSISVSLDLSNHNSPSIDRSKLNSLVNKAEIIDMDDDYYYYY